MAEARNKTRRGRDGGRESRAAADQFVDSVISVKRVTKVTKGGKRFSFSAFVVSGDQNGKIGSGLGKSREVSSAISKATARARKAMIDVALRGVTLPYDIQGQHGACNVLLRSAYKGTGVIAGGPMRAVCAVLGLKDVLAKNLSNGSPVNIVKATLNALSKCRSAEHMAKLRGKTVQEIVKG
ncbi:30S ribosomal protein S5 [bacterium]|jgi:small subunit ribosomal protein S5|nr:30S ribosomal protein S5 [bacterium]MBT4577799.1 30S ribosomal protein S5 [bacterium]MBT5346098.1 30S ribosomal protein S5 [bacterium]MBT6131367.1 30S ribosomal protein S5 [bacterium]MBT6528634.1 30S ribosomal protein S5 [bacterium]